ncbi:MAG: hypothetical protein JW828_00090 [Sedimentisphaerales bacterium]|nr:hypothetical protein [Sedimentisphaerales bacterium]
MHPAQYAGPILDKEMRVTSRRRRHYLLRSLYLGLLMLLIVLFWFEAMDSFDPNALMTSTMSETGMVIIACISWFQFIGLQIVTFILLSTAISEEIAHRTLPVLMTTPITSFQIVTGKLLSKLLQLLQLFAVSIPLLFLLRVFGGVPWDYLLSSTCITLTTIGFLACITLYFSISFKEAYLVMIFSVITAGFLFGLIPIVLFFLGQSYSYTVLYHFDLEDIAELAIFYLCPYMAFAQETEEMFFPGGTGGPGFYWPVHCGLMAALTIPIYLLACHKVRKAARKHIVARTHRKDYKIPTRHRKSDILYRPLFLHDLIRRTIGSGMVWKEFLSPVLGRWRFVVYGFFLVFLLLLLAGTFLTIFLDDINLIGFVLFSSVLAFFGLAALFTITVPASCITQEKESRCWPILLTTCMTDWQILGGKTAGVLRRILLAWFPFVFIFALIAYAAGFPWPAVFQVGTLALTAILFLICSGIYFSARLRRTTPAVIANLALIGILWGLIPLVCTVLNELYGWRSSGFGATIIEDTYFILWRLNPLGLGAIIIEHISQAHTYGRGYSHDPILKYWILYLVAYETASLLLLYRAKANLRRHWIE